MSLTAHDLIQLGYAHAVALNPHLFRHDDVAQYIEALLLRLERCNLDRSRVAANPLKSFSVARVQQNGKLLPQHANEVQACMQAVDEVIVAEASQRQIRLTTASYVSSKLANLSLPLTDSQVQLQQETIACLECGTFRSAIIVGWCFAYDVVRHWIFDDSQRLQDFNDSLVNKKGDRICEEIVHYEDFWGKSSLKESMVLIYGERAGLWGGKITRTLQYHLDERNSWAHANTKYPTPAQANAFLDKLCDELVANFSG